MLGVLEWHRVAVDRNGRDSALPAVACVIGARPCALCSGKSTFINHVIKREVQSTGVAPTDDCFTVIIPGKQDVDQSGPSVSEF